MTRENPYPVWVCPNGHTARYPEEPYNPCIECGEDDWTKQEEDQ